ncbi:TonB family protein [Gluconacetobacter sp. Hr-1-5]|uniref:TonB family protein n=1 Tax=Gluconacetobacter sp. Hr-1-5 TaxID=3395370 RepID=UPI003B52CD22
MNGMADIAETGDEAMAGAPFSYADWQRAQLSRTQREDAIRWGLSFLTVLAVTAGAVWWIMRLPPPVMPTPESPPAAIAVDLAPEPISTPTPPTDAAIGPQQTLSQVIPQPDPPPKLTAPPSPAPNPPIPVPKPEKPKLLKKRVKPVPNQKVKAPDKLPPATETTAPPSSDVPPAPTQAAPAPGASSTHASHDPVTWQGALLARLEQFKRYPAEAQEDHQEGVPTITFSMDRKGHVLSVRLESSSGHELLDQEAVALPKRADPLPSPPDDVKGDPVTLTVPVEFYLNKDRT